MPALVAAIHALLTASQQGVDGRDKPGHDETMTTKYDTVALTRPTVTGLPSPSPTDISWRRRCRPKSGLRQMQDTIVYLSHGGRKYHDQTRYSVLTLLALLLARRRHDVRIVVYTDQPDQLPTHDLITTVRIGAGDLAAWRGPLDYVHRIKLCVLKRALRDLGAPLIYVDSDTRWLQIPDGPFAALSGEAAGGGAPSCYLYKVECAISEQRFPQYFHLLRNSRSLLDVWRLPGEPPWTMWNSGTIGIPLRGAGFIDDALRVTDALLPHVGSRNCVEQLALSIVAESRFDVRSFDAYLEHWWPYGAELPAYLKRFFDPLPPGLQVAEQAARAARFSIIESDLRAIQRQPANRFARWRAKVRNSFYKRRIDLMAFALRRRQAAKGAIDGGAFGT
jgi:hypothetical protein